MESHFFEIGYQDQPVACFHDWYVNLTQLAGIAGASIDDFLDAPGTPHRLDLLAFCARDGNVMTVQMGRPGPDARDGREDEEWRDNGGPSDIWAHHSFAYEFLFWHGDSALSEWFMDQCVELYWREDFDDLRNALRHRVDQLQAQLDRLDPTDAYLTELCIECRRAAAALMAKLDGEIPTDVDIWDGDQFGHVSVQAMEQFMELLSFTKLLVS